MGTPDKGMFVGNFVPSASPDEFIRFWSWLYPDRVEPKYTSNIGRCSTFEQVMDLFKWKFPRFAEHNAQKLKSDYENIMLRWHDGTPAEEFLNQKFETGGAIWQLFGCIAAAPPSSPSFDQHVHRAMIFIEDGSKCPFEIQPDPDAKTVFRTYIGRYLPFHGRFQTVKERGEYDREIDRGLFMFGKTIGGANWIFAEEIRTGVPK